MARFLVTGGAGLIGSNLARALVDARERARVVDELSAGFWENLGELRGSERVERIAADIRDGAAMARAVEGAEVVFHQATLGSVPRSIATPVNSDSVNAHGTVPARDAARHAGVRRVVLAASSPAYGDTPTLPKHEDMPACPLSPYAASERAGEPSMRVLAALNGPETVSLRSFDVFGPHQRPDGADAAIPRFLWTALHGQELTVHGDGEQTRDCREVDNAAQANPLAAGTPRRLSAEVVGVAGSRQEAINARLQEIGRVLGVPPRVVHVDPRPGDVRPSLADVNRTRELLGCEPRVRWEGGPPPSAEHLRALARSRGGSCGA